MWECGYVCSKFIHSTVSYVEDSVLNNTYFPLTDPLIDINQLVYFFSLVGPSFDPDCNDSRVEPAPDLYYRKAS